MGKYLISYNRGVNAVCIENAIVHWDSISERNINQFECHYHEGEPCMIISITKLDA